MLRWNNSRRKRKWKSLKRLKKKGLKSKVSFFFFHIFSKNFVVLKNVLISERKALGFKFFSSSKPQLAQEIKKHIEIGMRPPMQIEATKTAMGDLNIVVKMSPGVELTTLKMKIPKDMEKGSNIEVNFNGSVKTAPRRRRRINKPKMV